MSNSKTKRLAALVITGVLLSAGLASTAAPAFAADDPGTQVIEDGNLTITPTTGSATDFPMLQTMTTATQCPVGYREKAHNVAFQNGVYMGALGITWDTSIISAFGNGGLSGPVQLSAADSFDFLTDKALADITTPLATGDWEIRRYCWSDPNVRKLESDPYFVLPMTFDATAGTWAVKAAPVAEQGVVSNFTVVGNSNGTVSAAASVQAGASGKIEFYENNVKVGEGPVLAGNASWTSGIIAAGNYSYTAKFISSNPATFTDSAVAGPVALVHTGSSVSYEGTPAGVDVTVEVPATIENNGLKLSVANTAVNLGTAAANGGKYTASGNLGAVTVTDSRQVKAGWDLTGVNSVFTNQADATKTIAAKALGWTPSVTSTEDAATAGASVAAWDAGLDGAKTLASAVANGLAGPKATSADAALSFAVPADGTVAPGTYKSTLTLTLI
ncbi:hypothetical protein [Agromyces sp. Soil535]|uniref:hypothetical protein n=1 Tax=Agromyces sp. Soil535 TaxID=1736390 RepID=UPI0006F7DAD8|nr:hypothetical protein [Agromyces sp. Soil535]KRE23022.1 hypothetical protein ASG80_09160 [Agromyces sp. Soil535]